MKLIKKTVKALANKCGYTIIKTANLEEQIRQIQVEAGRKNHLIPTILVQDIKMLFQPGYYQAVYPDIDYAGLSPFEHYMSIGWKEGKNPNPYLYSSWYLESYPEARESGLSPLEHYYKFGAEKDYDPSPRFSTRAYKALYPEAGAGNPLAYHFLIGLDAGNLAVLTSMAEKVLAACERRYPDIWARRLTVPFAPALAWGDDRKAFDKSVWCFCESLKETVKIARRTGDWVSSVDLALSGASGQVDFRRGIVSASQALVGWGSSCDCLAQSYFLLLVLNILAECCLEGRDKIIAAIPDGWRSHPMVRLTLALWALQVDDEEGLSRHRATIEGTYLQRYTETLDIMRLERGFARERSVSLPSWYYDLHGYHCPAPFMTLHLGTDINLNRTHALFCCNILAPFLLDVGENLDTDEKPHSNQSPMWDSPSAKEFRRSIVDGDYTYCSRRVCKIVLQSDKIRSQLDTSRRHEIQSTIQAFKNCGQTPATPMYVLLDLDWTCNLACPACRKEHYHAKPGQVAKLIAIYDLQVKPLLRHNRPISLFLDGAGEALASKVGLHILDDLRAAGNPEAKLFLITNGQLLTESIWDRKLQGLNLAGVYISIDAATKETYELVRYPGKWATLCRNMDNLADKTKSGGGGDSFPFNFVCHPEG